MRIPVNRALNSTEQPIGDKINEEQLRRYATLMDEFRRENESKVPGTNFCPAEFPKCCRLTAWESNYLFGSPRES